MFELISPLIIWWDGIDMFCRRWVMLSMLSSRLDTDTAI